MGVASQVFHHVPKPVSFVEFYEAMQAACPPRFPHAVQSVPRRVALAVSGGVDSMALAFLMNRLRAQDANFRIADNTLASRPVAIVVDHRLRPESTAEATNVIRQLGRFPHLGSHLVTINWRDELHVGPDFDPNTLPNIESLARRFRYRRIAKHLVKAGVASVFTAHHQDDQYETVLMRLLGGHGVRGLRGMGQANNIPECYDMHGVYESGFVDDQLKSQPFVNFRPRRRDWRFERRDLREEIDMPTHMGELRAGLQTELDIAYIDRQYGDDPAKYRHKAPAIPPIPTEDMGMVVYRPLLGFSKDRLIATCEANKIKWFEDPTNQDQTMTLRNAVRHMWKNHQLPVALQKESVLRLSKYCTDKTRAQDQEADRWLSKAIVHDFEPNTGTLVVKVPDLGVPRAARRSIYNRRRRELRLVRRRTIAALIIRRLVAFVTPDRALPLVSTLQASISRLFPSIAPASEAAKAGQTPKPFNQASVLFIPLQPTADRGLAGANPLRSPSPQKWFLTRQPYTSSQPLPTKTWITRAERKEPFFFLGETSVPPWSYDTSEEGGPQLPGVPMASRDWHDWRQWALFDGRFWVRIRARYKGALRVAPFNEAFAKEFREGLDDKGRAALADLLRRYAPGKVRYTLPALYTVHTPRPEEEEGEDNGAVEEVDDGQGVGDEEEGGDGATASASVKTTSPPQPQPLKLVARGDMWISDIDSWRGRKTKIKMLALLTLPVHLPGVDDWVQWEVRYKKVDTDLLDKTMPLPRRVRPARWPVTGLRWRRRRKLYQYDQDMYDYQGMDR